MHNYWIEKPEKYIYRSSYRQTDADDSNKKKSRMYEGSWFVGVCAWPCLHRNTESYEPVDYELSIFIIKQINFLDK